MDHREEELGNSDSDDPAQRDEVSIDPMQNGLQRLSFARVAAEEQAKEFLDEGLVDHGFQAVRLKMRMLKESEKDRVSQGQVGPQWVLPFLLLLKNISSVCLLDVWKRSENVCRHHFDKIADQSAAQCGEVLSSEVEKLFEGGRLPPASQR